MHSSHSHTVSRAHIQVAGGMARQAAASEGAPGSHRRGGAALIVVISLLGTLAFLGFLFYSFAAQEVASAEYFSQSQTPDVPLPPDVFWDWSLKQLIVGTDAGLTNSALYGNKYSLLANMLGPPNSADLTWGIGASTFEGDTQPFDGAGITTFATEFNPDPSVAGERLQFGFDINQDGFYDDGSISGTAEPDWTNFVMNFSPAADAPTGGPYSQNFTQFSGSTFYREYQPDAGYTYPDINSPFLAYDTLVRGWPNGANATPRDYRVVIPSFFRPQLFPARRGANDDSATTAAGVPRGTNDNGFADLYLADQTARQVLRPHVAHIASFAPLVRRYVPPVLPAYLGELDGDADGDGNPDGIQAKSGDHTRVVRPFPFVVDLDDDGNFNEMGVWTNPFQGQATPADGVNYELDVDADGDGIRDAIWMDLDFPLMTLEDGRQFVPMFAVKMIDADALLNVNAHGNANGLYVRMQDGSIKVIGPDGTRIVSTGGLAEGISFHQSNQGLSPSEINLSLALTADLRIEDPSNPGQPHPTLSHVDPSAAQPISRTTVDDLIATQFDLAWNYRYNPGPYPGGAGAGPTMPGTGAEYTPAELRSPGNAELSNLEALLILNGRREFDQLRNGQVRETRNQTLGRHGDRFKIRELYRRLAFGDPDYNDGLFDDEILPGPLPGGFNLDDDGDSNQTGLAPFFDDPATLPLPGDDDIDAPGIVSNNLKRGGGSFYYDQDLYGVQIPPAVHPLDFLGLGSGIYDRSPTMSVFLNRQLGGPSTANWPAAMTNNPSVFLSYFDPFGVAEEIAGTGVAYNYWHYQGIAPDVGDPDLSGIRPWRLGLDPVLNPPPAPVLGYLDENNPLYDFLIDEANEVILEPEFRNPEYDSVFPTYEMEGLHLSRSDASKIKVGSRLRQLASVNLAKVKEEVASTIRKRLTTDSWDRLEPGQTRYRGTTGSPAFRAWEYNIWNTGDPSAADFYTEGETFPPEFEDGVGGRTLAGTANDPFRPPTRLLLRNEWKFSGGITGDVLYPRHQLNINRILAGEDGTAPATPADIDRRAFDTDGNPRFRQLTPHPNVTQLRTIDSAIGSVTIPAMVHDNVGMNTPPAVAPPFTDLDLSPQPVEPTPTTAEFETLIRAQEWWARYDRQRMARDIYVLLYTLGAGDDDFNPTTGTYPSTPDDNSNGINDNLDLAAQFAVNYVDALDHDNVITKFEYDGNLSDGWQWTSGGVANDSVNGVEAQQLTFSEVIWTIARDPGTNNGRTFWADDDHEHQYLHIELRSTSPFDTVLDDESYRIVREENDPAASRPAVLTFTSDTGGNALTVGGGETFTIGTTDGVLTNGLDVADFYIDHDGDSNWECLVPAGTQTVPNPADMTVRPRTDLDLVTSQTKPGFAAYSQYFTLNSGGTDANGNTLGTNLVGTTAATDPTTSFYLVLERRRQFNGEGLLSQSVSSGTPPSDPVDDWIEVDRILVTANDFNPAGETTTDMENARNGVRSDYRLEPLNAPQDFTLTTRTTGSVTMHPNHTIADYWDPTGAMENTLRHSNNVDQPGTLPDPTTGTPPTTTAFTLWQPHFDRDYTSVFELLAVPLFGPEELTRRLADGAGKISGLDKGDGTNGIPVRPALAGRLFLNTDPLNDTDYAMGMGLADDNRWYRVLEFLQVPNRAEEAIRERIGEIVRTPGKLNLNTIRDEQVLAALLDDLFILKFQDPNGRMTSSDPGLESLGGGSNVNVPPGTLPTYEDVRNWMDEMRLARDGIDPVNYFASLPADRTYLPLPGIPGMAGDPNDTSIEYGSTAGRPQFGAIPFRPFSYVSPVKTLSVTTSTSTPVDSSIPPLAHTILRNHIAGVGNASADEQIDRKDGLSNLQLFEARPTSDVGTDDYDYHTRHRLLAKLANNSTERSNVFACWIVVEFFEAHQPDPTNNPEIVQVGGKLEGSPTHRGFFVIDRTRLERAVDQESIPAATRGNGDGRDDNFRFDWRNFVIHRRTIQ